MVALALTGRSWMRGLQWITATEEIQQFVHLAMELDQPGTTN
jgi:hypothetical protein